MWDPWRLSSPRHTLAVKSQTRSQRPPAVTGLKRGSESVTRTWCGHPGQSPKVRTTGERDVKNWTAKKTRTGGTENSLPPAAGPSGTSQQDNPQTAQDCGPKNLPHSQHGDREKGTSPADTAPNQVKTNNLASNPLPQRIRLPTQVSRGATALLYPNGAAQIPDLSTALQRQLCQGVTASRSYGLMT